MAFPLIIPEPAFHDDSGNLLASGTIEFRDPDTDSLIDSYPTADDADAQTNANANPLTLNAAGKAGTGLFLEDDRSYKVVLKDSAGSTVDTHTDVRAPARGFHVVDSIAALKALNVDAQTRVFVTGYYAANDGGGGQYILDSGSAASDNGGTIIAPDTGSGRWELLLDGPVSVRQFGAKGDDATDDYTAFNAALTAETDVYAPDGTYLLGTSLEFQQTGNRLFGSGPDQCILKGTHTSGPVVRLQYFFNVIEGLTVGADATRTAGAVSTNCGILKEAVDSVGQHAKSCQMRNIRVEDQPGHGVAWCASFSSGVMENFEIHDNGGHGVIVDNGTFTSRTNTSRPGGIDIRNGVVFDNTGHAFRIGDDDGSTNYPYRIRIDNVDTYRNALAAGVRKTADNSWFYMNNSIITRSAFGGRNGSNVPTVGAFFVAGRHIHIDFPRLIGNTQPPITVGDVSADGITTRGVSIPNIHNSDMSANADPAVVIDSAASGVDVGSVENTEIDSIATPSNNSDWRLQSTRYWGTDNRFKSVQSLDVRTIADEGFEDIEFDSDPTAGIAVIASNTGAREYGIVYFRVGTSPSVVALAASANVTVTTGALSGTTGVNGDLTISAHTDKKLYIENQTSASGNYTVTFLGVVGGDVLPAELLA